ncbi:DUF2934 domain-containing protein (plasmid) [Shinella sp. PSBB067]|uniref:DUF2934 domain-containing protein n=1 Tax=Shinella sp. PSBB067 TaxID=2715959 RepID=UPI00193B19D6|nr:DUF2934 domain-containing protein [Shinella sp. PSBB067]QRI61572.1 DUF2934 domain-containing protein [Shinella sp. PSBB067]
MTDTRREWISKRAYSIWETAGRTHGHDAEHWEQAVREREEFERVALATEAKPAEARKPLIEISGKAKPKKTAAAAEKPAAAGKTKSARAPASSKPA